MSQLSRKASATCFWIFKQISETLSPGAKATSSLMMAFPVLDKEVFAPEGTENKGEIKWVFLSFDFEFLEFVSFYASTAAE